MSDNSSTSDERAKIAPPRTAPEADVVLHPDIGYYAGHNKDYRRRVIAAAEAYTRRHVPAIQAALAKAGPAQPQSKVGATLRMPAAEASR